MMQESTFDGFRHVPTLEACLGNYHNYQKAPVQRTRRVIVKKIINPQHFHEKGNKFGAGIQMPFSFEI